MSSMLYLELLKGNQNIKKIILKTDILRENGDVT